jgi:threonine aldolase
MMTDRLLTRADCAHAIAGHAFLTPADALREVAERAGNADRDYYGEGTSLHAFEDKIAVLLGKEAAVFMPSGTMAQQIALRIVADARGARTFAAHATTHVVLHERDGFARLHDLTFVPVGSPIALFSAAEVRALRGPIGALLVELPLREIGGELPSWDELVAIVEAARAQNMHVHLDGARLWECAPYYGRSYAEIAALFDSVYVSFYKGIGGIAGAMLLGTQTFIDEARTWQRAHGGNLIALFPYALAAEQAFDDRIGRMADYHHAALRIAQTLAAYPNVTIRPNPPRTNMLHAFIRADAGALMSRVQHVAREHGIFTIGRLTATVIPGVHKWEISCGDAALALTDAQVRTAFDGLFLD